MMKMHKRIHVVSVILFYFYMLALVYFLLLSDGFGRLSVYEEYHYNLIPFREIKRFILYWKAIDNIFLVVMNLFGNVLAFIPFGALIRWVINRSVKWYQVVGYTFLLSLSVEILQLIAKVGVFDIDDLILNTFGGLVGFWIYYFLRSIDHRRRKDDKRK
ncbi:MAG: VanZ family protein [Lachnospiraceae bacterium]